MLGSEGASEVLNDHEILANNKDEKGWGDDRAGETEEHPDSEVNNNPDIFICQTQSVTIYVSYLSFTLPPSSFPLLPEPAVGQLGKQQETQGAHPVQLQLALQEGHHHQQVGVESTSVCTEHTLPLV